MGDSTYSLPLFPSYFTSSLSLTLLNSPQALVSSSVMSDRICISTRGADHTRISAQDVLACSGAGK